MPCARVKILVMYKCPLYKEKKHKTINAKIQPIRNANYPTSY